MKVQNINANGTKVEITKTDEIACCKVMDTRREYNVWTSECGRRFVRWGINQFIEIDGGNRVEHIFNIW